MSDDDKRLARIIRKELNYDGPLEPSTRFSEDMGADSLDTVEYVMAIEEEFDIEIEDRDVAWSTYGDLVAYMKNRAAKVAGA